MRIALIWSQTSDGSIGDKGELLHRFSDDLARFSSLTRNNIVLMGRKTWESLPDKSRPLPNRVNLVLTRDPNYKAEGAIVFTSMEEALIYASSIATWRQRLFVIGGAEIYKQALPYATDAYETLIYSDRTGDAKFPVVDLLGWNKVNVSQCFFFSNKGHEPDHIRFRFIDYTNPAPKEIPHGPT